MTIKVSIIIAAFNAGRHIERTLDSALAQSLNGIEIIVVDDGSSDNTRAVVQNLIDENSTIKLVCHERNLGLATTRNTGLEQASGAFVLFFDADDILDADAALRLHRAAIKYEADTVRGLLARRYPDRTIVPARQRPQLSISGKTILKKSPALLTEFSVCGTLFRRQFLIDEKVRFPDGLYMQDIAFTLCAFSKAKTIVFCPSVIGYYIQSPASSSRQNNQKRFDSLFVIFDQIESIISDTGADQDFKTNICSAFLHTAVNGFMTWKLEQKDEDSLVRLRQLLERSGDPAIAAFGIQSGDGLTMCKLALVRYGNFDKARLDPSNLSALSALQRGIFERALADIENKRYDGPIHIGDHPRWTLFKQILKQRFVRY